MTDLSERLTTQTRYNCQFFAGGPRQQVVAAFDIISAHPADSLHFAL
jgi:hypothetical protein